MTTTMAPAPTRVRPTDPAVCTGRVRHVRLGATPHSFEQPLAMVWIDPDEPDDLFGRHPLWSARHVAPIRFRRSDHGHAGDRRPLGAAVRDELTEVLGGRPHGPVRLLTQPRIWGWSFNPISIYVAWNDPGEDPVGLVAEVTNTPWHDRHRYAVALSADDRPGWVSATFAKRMHVSPFLPPEGRYELALGARDETLLLEIGFIPADPDTSGVDGLQARLDVQRLAPTRRAMRRMLYSPWLPTHRVTAAIRRHAYRLWRGGAPVHAHPQGGRR
jgi:DUF1365 family protein